MLLKAGSLLTTWRTTTRRSARRAAEAIEADRRDAVYAAHGSALHQIKAFARAGFLLLPEAREEKFEQLWRTAFQTAGPDEGGVIF